MESIFTKKDHYLKEDSLPIVERICFYESINADFMISHTYTIILMMRGCVLFNMLDGKKINIRKGELAFIPIGMLSHIEIMPKTKLILIRLSALQDWNLYCTVPEDTNKPETCFMDKISSTGKTPKAFTIKRELSAYIRSLNSCVSYAGEDTKLMEVKVKELLILLKACYSKEELQQFFADVTDKELSFVEYVEQNWDRYATLQEFSEAMHLTMRQFTRRFRALFSTSPYQWMLNQKSRRIHRELMYTQKPLARISTEQHFKSVSHFNLFCKKHLGETPGAIRKKRKTEECAAKENDKEKGKRGKGYAYANN